LPVGATLQLPSRPTARPCGLDEPRHVMKCLVGLPLLTPSPLAADVDWLPRKSHSNCRARARSRGSKLGNSFVNGLDGMIRFDDRVRISVKALELQMSILVIAYAWPMSHGDVKATELALREAFSWAVPQEDVAAFILQCLQCQCIDGGMVPRPIGERLMRLYFGPRPVRSP
jgi:hypothetical protein